MASMADLVTEVPTLSLPTRMQYRFREITKIGKATVPITPSIGQAPVKAGDTIIVELPFNTVIDLTTFIMEFDGETTDNGKITTGPTNHRQTRFFPRNTASIIEQLDVEVNGQSRFSCNNYGLLYNTLFDLTCAQDSLNRRKVGENADPSSKYYTDATGNVRERRGYSIGNVTNDTVSDKDHYVIRSWLGLLSPSTSIIDTNLLGSVVIKIRLAPPTCLILGAQCDTSVNNIAENADNNETGVVVSAASGDATPINSTQPDYTLKNVKFSIVRYQMPADFYASEAAKLKSGAVFKLWFSNYTIQSCPRVRANNKQGVNRTSISTKSLDWVMGTFRLPDYDTISYPLNSLKPSPSSYGVVGSTKRTWEDQVRAGLRRLFNNSRYFARNGSSITKTQWTVGFKEEPARNMQQQFDHVLQHFNIQNDQGAGGMYPGIQSLHHFRETFYCDIVSLTCNQSETDYVIAGLDTQETPLQITWDVTSEPTGIIDELIPDVSKDCTPYLICGYTSCLEMQGGRQITLIN